MKNNGPTLQSLEKLLLDAQKESQTGHSSLKGSFLGSLPITPDGLQTPPNSIYFNNNVITDCTNEIISKKNFSLSTK